MILAANTKLTLGDIAEFMNGGSWSQDEYSEHGVPVVRVTDIKSETVDLSDCKFLPEKSLNKYERHLLKKGDLVICTVGSHPTQPGSVVGRAAIIPSKADGALLNQNAVRLRAAKPNVDQQWLGYLGRSRVFHNYIISCARGSANQVRMAIGLLKEMPVQLPPLPVQRRIAGILSAYDDLIENNLRRIRILEEMARALYREWFIHFRFPGHESAPRVASALGPIPRGWEATTIGRAFTTTLGGTPSREKAEYWQDGTVPWINSGKVNDLRIIEPSELITELALEKSAAKLMPRGTTVLAITGATLGQVSYLEIDTTANQSVVGITDRSGGLSEWLYLMFKERIHEIIQHASGGAQQHINKEVVNDVQIVIPSSEHASRFKNVVAPMFHQLAAHIIKNKNLRHTRDLLLPQLLSGKLTLLS